MFEIEKFIKEVEKRPALYEAKSGRNGNKVSDLWTEVCRIMYENWDQLGSKEKSEKGSELQKKWKSLKDCFKRELRIQKRTRTAGVQRNQKKYMYFDKLLFLEKPTEIKAEYFEARLSSSNDTDTQIVTDSIAPTMIIPLPENHIDIQGMPNTILDNVSTPENLSEILDDDNEIDSDRKFLLSNLTAFTKFPAATKAWVKVKISEIMLEAELGNINKAPTRNMRPVELGKRRRNISDCVISEKVIILE